MILLYFIRISLSTQKIFVLFGRWKVEVGRCEVEGGPTFLFFKFPYTVLFGLNTPPLPILWLLSRGGVFKEHVLKMVNLDF